MDSILVPYAFVSGVYEVDRLMKMYIKYLFSTKTEKNILIQQYDSHIVARAFETLFNETFYCVSGYYVSAKMEEISFNDLHEKDFSHRSQVHSWLVFKGNPHFVVDVIPVDGVFGLTPVIPFFLNNNSYGYISSESKDLPHWDTHQKQKMEKDVKDFVNILNNLRTEALF
ncbi:MAG: hypothetical protein KBC41_00310 [Candidatus Pacebacteria bacterium]|nr:hypothetical protein [Candidatus Paceibacterota bacterium]MBP9866509.1 hypothetical protein [Candidatus Paceibacterota bacterium]